MCFGVEVSGRESVEARNNTSLTHPKEINLPPTTLMDVIKQPSLAFSDLTSFRVESSRFGVW